MESKVKLATFLSLGASIASDFLNNKSLNQNIAYELGSAEGKIFLAPQRHLILDLSRAKLIRQRMLAMILLYGSLVL